MNRIAFYIMSSRGFFVLNSFIQNYGAKSIAFVVCNKDKNIKKDFYSEIKALSIKLGITFFKKSDDYKEIEKDFEGYKFAIGWRWLIENNNKLIVLHYSTQGSNECYVGQFLITVSK